MKLLKDRILSEGRALNEDILKVDSFINHQVDMELMSAIGKELADHFRERQVTKVVTIESSGIPPASMVALSLGVPMVVLKKQGSKVLNEDMIQTEVTSFTKGNTYELSLCKRFISEDDHVLFIDDFLANGEAATGTIRLLRQLHATIAGIGILVEKSFMPGRGKIEAAGFEVYSLARIKRLDKGIIEFIDD
ncbi:MAG: xanthine phosphoribosyltransferase [Lachnospiraceae bacterium]|nr:xanthine phosphoribosyltransferase [Lachnospiraceae bacterium]